MEKTGKISIAKEIKEKIPVKIFHSAKKRPNCAIQYSGLSYREFDENW